MQENISVMDKISNTDNLEISMYPRGIPGYTFTPSVSEDGILTWKNNGGLTNPSAVNIMGPAGKNSEISLNGEVSQNVAFYAPIEAGVNGQILVSQGSEKTPQWIDLPSNTLINTLSTDDNGIVESYFTDVSATSNSLLTSIVLSPGIWIITGHIQHQGKNKRWHLSIPNTDIQMGAYDNSGWIDGMISGIIAVTQNTTYELRASFMTYEDEPIETICHNGYLKAVKIR